MKVRIDVGEPREFDTGGGNKTIIGTIASELSGGREVEQDPRLAVTLQAPGSSAEAEPVKKDKVKEFWFVVEFPKITSGNMSISSLLMTPRYRLKKSPEEMLAKGRELVVNAIWRSSGEDWDAASIEAARSGDLDGVEGLIVARVLELKEG